MISPQAIEIWNNRPDLRQEFSSPEAKGKSGDWTLQDWYERYSVKNTSETDEWKGRKDYDTQRAYGIWKTRPDLRKEFPTFTGKGKSGDWTMKDWYERYNKTEKYDNPERNFFGLNVSPAENLTGDDENKDLYGAFYRKDNSIKYNKTLLDSDIPKKQDVVNHELGHYLMKDATYGELRNLFGDSSDVFNLNDFGKLAEVAADSYADYKRGTIKDTKRNKQLIEYFQDLEETNYK